MREDNTERSEREVKMKIRIIAIAAIMAMIAGANVERIPTIEGSLNPSTVTTNSIIPKKTPAAKTKKTEKKKTKQKKVAEQKINAYKVRCTCYIPTGNPTASGVYPYEGIIATNREHLGESCNLYDMDMNLIGHFESLDTGGHEGLKNGTRIDVFRDTLDRAYDWVGTYGDYVYIEWLGVEE